MTQNTSSAVMQQRHESKKSLDFFPTPAWATRALCEHILNKDFIKSDIVYEPACGHLHMVKPLIEYFDTVFSSDIEQREFRGQEYLQHDFLMPYLPKDFENKNIDWVITNPPFTLAEDFIVRALNMDCHVAIIARTSFVEGKGRYNNLFKNNPPSIVAQFVERVPMVKGRVDAKASSATSYAWFVWYKGNKYVQETDFKWIPPCRKELERPEEDYDAK